MQISRGGLIRKGNHCLATLTHKYIVAEIFAYGLYLTGAISKMFHSSRKHREFLLKNASWYMRGIKKQQLVKEMSCETQTTLDGMQVHYMLRYLRLE